MNRASGATLCLVLSCLAARLAWGDAPPSGFSSAVASQAYSASMDALFLGESDGYLDSLDTAAGRVVSRYRVSPSPVVLIACHPEKNELCAVASDGISTHTVFFLKYGNGAFVELKRERLPEKPESICYSPKGGLLVIADRGARGLTVKETAEYSDIAGFPANCGPTSFAAVGSSEKSLLQYSPQGRLVYRSLPDGAVLQTSKTVADLLSPCLTADKKTILAIDHGDFVSIDSQTGKLNYSFAAKGLSAFAAPDATGKCLFCLENGSYQEADPSARAMPSGASSVPSPFLSIVRTAQGYSGLDGRGAVSLSVPEGGFVQLPQDPYFKARFAVPFVDGDEPGYLISSQDEALFVSEKELLASRLEGAPGAKPLKAPIRGVTALSSYGSSLYAAASAPKPALAFVNGLSGDAEGIPLPGASAVIRMSRSDFATLAIQANGTLSRLEAGSSKRLVSVNGILDAVAISSHRVAIGKARGGSLAAPLLFYSLDKGELSPLPLDAIAVLRIVSVAEDRFLVLAVENGADGVATSIRELTTAPASNRLIASFPGERIDARFGFLPPGAVFYSVGDTAAVYRSDGPAAPPEEYKLDDLPVFLCAGRESLCVLHEDGSFSVIGLEKGQAGRFAIGTGQAVFRLE